MRKTELQARVKELEARVKFLEEVLEEKRKLLGMAIDWLIAWNKAAGTMEDKQCDL